MQALCKRLKKAFANAFLFVWLEKICLERAWVWEAGAIMPDDAYDVVVVGAGPGGSTCAAFLGKKGRKVLLVDKEKFPRDKTCGDAISGKSMSILRELGLDSEVERSDHGVVGGVLFSSPEGRMVRIPLRKGDGKLERSYTCRRQVYDNLLFRNAAKSATVLEGASAIELVKEEGRVVGVKLRTPDGERVVRAKIVVGADGTGSAIAKGVEGHEVDPAHTCIAYRGYYSGIADAKDSLEIHFVKSIMPGYFWIFPLENGIANVGVGMVMEDMKKKGASPQKAMEEMLASNPLFRQRFANAKLVSQIKAWSLPFGSKKRAGSAAGLLLVGDAFGLVDPFSGEGIGNAMLSGKIAAEVADEALSEGDFSGERLKKYDERVWAAVGGELDTSYKMQKLGKNEWLLNFVVAKAEKSERAREAIASTFTSQEAKQGYSSPLFYFKLLFS